MKQMNEILRKYNLIFLCLPSLQWKCLKHIPIEIFINIYQQVDIFVLQRQLAMTENLFYNR